MAVDKSIGKALKAIRDSNGWTLEQMASILGTTKQAISRYERGERVPKLDVSAKFSKILGVSLEMIAGSEPVPTKGIIQMPSMTVHRIPLIGATAAGEPVYDEMVDVYIDGPLRADCALRVKGNSMEPTFLDGDLLYVRSQPNVDFDGQIAVVICGEEACVKHVYRQEDGLMLMSDNPKYAPMLKRFSDYDGNIRILGKVIGFTRIFKQ